MARNRPGPGLLRKRGAVPLQCNDGHATTRVAQALRAIAEFVALPVMPAKLADARVGQLHGRRHPADSLTGSIASKPSIAGRMENKAVPAKNAIPAYWI